MLAAEQSKRGWCVHVGIRQGGCYLERLQASGVKVHLLGDHRGINPVLLISINALIKQTKPDLVQTWLPQMDIVGGISALWHSVPWIVSERSSKLAYQGLSLRVMMRDFCARYANTVVANSFNGVTYWQEMMPPEASICQIANAVDVEAIRNAEPVRFVSNSDGPYFLVVGRLAPEKAIDVIIQAVRLIPEEHNIRAVIIGSGPLYDEIEASIREAGLGNRIVLLPYRTDWWGMLKNASAIVSMSRFEGHPNVVLEAMAARCPLIVSEIPGHLEFLDEDSAILVPTDSPTDLAEAMVSLLTAPASARRRAMCAARRVYGMTIHGTADAYERVYEKVLSEKEG